MSRKMFFIFSVSLSLVLAACSGISSDSFTSSDSTVSDNLGQSAAVGQQEQVAQQTSSDKSQVPSNSLQNEPVASSIQLNESYSYTIVDTGQIYCYDNNKSIACPSEGETFFGQDGSYSGVAAAYQDNGDGTVSDLNTGLIWQQTPDLNNKSTWNEAMAGADSFNLAGYDDWRLPSIKELYSLTNFNGSSFYNIPYIDTNYFDFVYGDESAGERQIDAQYWSSTKSISPTGQFSSETVFGVNFADGRIKGYGMNSPRGEMRQFVRYVRGNTSYGINSFADNGDGTISDNATGLMWMQSDSGSPILWADAISTCEALDASGYSDWRLPNTKELQSIVDYNRAPTVTNSAAIDPLFNVTEIESWYWASTTLKEGPDASNGIYITFGRAFGVYNGELVDVHGAGAQRSDWKTGNASDWPDGWGPQNDQVRITNYARCVRGNSPTTNTGGATDPDETGAQSPPSGGGDGQQPPSGGGDGGQQLPPGGGGGGGNLPPPGGGGGQQPPPGGGGGEQP